jgi:hypothetical protein
MPNNCDNQMDLTGFHEPALLEFEAYRMKETDTDDVSHFTVTPGKPEAKFIIVSYNGLSGNLPKTYKNSIALWLGSIPNMAKAPLKIVEIDKDRQAGDVVIEEDFQQLFYSFTYQVGALETMCALAQLDLTNTILEPKNGDGDEQQHPGTGKSEIEPESPESHESLEIAINIPTYVDIEILELTTSSVKVLYSTLPGYLPKTYKNWVGVWQGYTQPYNAPSPMRSVNITQDYTEGIVILDNVSFEEYFTYTLIYFTGPDKTNAASLLYFDTKSKSQGLMMQF